MSLNRMLLPITLEPQDAKLLAYACGLSVQGVQELIVAHVVDSSGQEAPVILHEVERARNQLREMVAPYSDCGMRIEVRVANGERYREIMTLAHQANIDVICCVTEGKSFIDYLFTGSVSEDLALKGDERTMTVRRELLQATDDPGQLARDFAKRLVVPTDFSGSATRALLSAFNRAKEGLGEVHVLHVLSDGMSLEEAETQLRAFTAMAEEHAAKIVPVVREGAPTTVILDYLTEIDATGVITGRTGRTQFGRGLLGSTAMTLIQDAPCPVVVQP